MAAPAEQQLIAALDIGSSKVSALIVAPGGLVGVIDHYARPAEDPRRSAMETHRIDPDVVLSDFRGAGFALEAQCDVLRNVADDRTKSVFDDAIRGRTDRFVMRFRRMD